MPSNSKQNESGRAFEYAVLLALLAESKRRNYPLVLRPSNALKQARDAYAGITRSAKLDLKLAAIAGIETVCLLEPRLFDTSDTTRTDIYLSEDRAGKKGDPRDIVVERGLWQMGVSAKHESPWIKSPRLSNLASFGKDWLNVDCTDLYREAVTDAFSLVKPYFRSPWNELDTTLKEEVYGKVANAFAEELLRLESLYGSQVPENLMRFLLGNFDYYKLLRKGRTTQLQPINVHGSLSKKTKIGNSITKIGKIPLPSRFLQIEMHSWNRLRIYFDAGWQIEMRVHNKDTAISQSLAFETEILGQPAALVTLLMPWGLNV